MELSTITQLLGSEDLGLFFHGGVRGGGPFLFVFGVSQDDL